MLEAPALGYPEKNLPWMNTLAYFALLSVTKKKKVYNPVTSWTKRLSAIARKERIWT
jgi:hypothetical protein